MGDNRYHELLGLDPAIESPTYYELLVLAPADATSDAIENHYKEQMTKLQHIKSPKHKGFIEYLKDELRNAKLTLSNSDRRKEYDGKLGSKHLEAFREFAKPFMALGEVPRKVYATIVSTGVSKHGITDAEATKIVDEVMAAAGAKIAAEVEAHAAEPAPQAAPPPPPPPPPAQHVAHGAEPVAAPAGGDPLAFFDEAETPAQHAPPAASSHHHPTPLATPFSPAALRPPAAPTYMGAGGHAPSAPSDHFSDAPPADAAYGVEQPQPQARSMPPGMQRGFPRATPAPPPSSQPPTPGRDPNESSQGARTSPAPPSDVQPRIQRANRFYGSEDAYRPGGATGGGSAGSGSAGSGSEGGYRPWGGSGSGTSDAYGRPAESGRAGSDAYGRGGPQDTGRGGSDSHARSSPSDSGRMGSGEYGASKPSDRLPRREPETPGTPAGPSAAANARAAYMNQQDAKAAEEARKSYNGAIKLSRIAIQAHVSLADYFPRSGDMQSRINGVWYEDVLRTEHKMWREALPFFQKTVEKLMGVRGPLSEDLRARAETNVRNIEHYVKEWKDLKFKLEFEAVKKGELIRLYRDFVASKRSDALNHEIPKPEGPVATT